MKPKGSYSTSISMRQSRTLIVSLLILIIWICIFFSIYPLKESGWMSCSRPVVPEVPPDSVPVPIKQIMTGEPVILEQDDKAIIDYILNNGHLEIPSNESYNLKNPGEDPSRGQAQFIRRILGNMTNGFFVECGALDGETRSNTLFMEQHLNWEGLLVEGDPSNYQLMREKHRKAWLSNSCLAIKPYPHQVTYLQDFNVGRIMGKNSEEDSRGKTVQVQCFPLYSLLSALNIKTIDYFSLDVEGSELKVLKTIPFDKVLIKTLSVEYVHTKEGKKAMIDFLRSKGYKNVGEVHYPGNLANDVIFAHESVKIHT